MKNKPLIISIFISSIMLVISLAIIIFVSIDERQYLCKRLEVDISKGSEIYSYDDHGGFLGDGYAIKTFKFKDDSLLEEIKNAKHWKQLPLTDELAYYLYGEGNEDCPVFEVNGKSLIPKVKNGYYFFYDTQPECVDHYDDVEFANRYSYNFEVAIYDIDSRMLYYAEVDT